MKITITHIIEDHQFSYREDGKTARLDYAILPDGKTLDYYSTYVPPELRGRQIAQMIVEFALDYAKTNHYKVMPSCSYVSSYIKRHPEYGDIVV